MSDPFRILLVIFVIAGAAMGCDGRGASTQNQRSPIPLLYPGARYDTGNIVGGAIAVADLNGDTFDDVVTGHENGVTVYYAAGDGTLVAGPTLNADNNAILWVAIADFNGDSTLDIAAQSLGATSIMLGQGDETFASPQIIFSSPGHLTPANIDGDGDIDLVVAQTFEGPRIMRNNGAGVFSMQGPPLIADRTPAVALADFNDDGAVDIACALGNNAVAVLFNDGNGGVASEFRSTQGSNALVAGDINDDGIADLVGLGRRGLADEVWSMISLGDGTFAEPFRRVTEADSKSMLLHDFNRDSIPDLIVADNRQDAITVLPGNGDGSLGLQTVLFAAEDPEEIGLGHFDSDSNPDLAAGFQSGLSIYLGTSAGFRAPKSTSTEPYLSNRISLVNVNSSAVLDVLLTRSNGASVFFGATDGTFGNRLDITLPGDLQGATSLHANADNTIDIAVAALGANVLYVLLGDGAGQFEDAVSLPTGDGPLDVASGDFNGDGNADLTCVNAIANTLSFFPGNGDGTFGSAIVRATGQVPHALAVGRFNADDVDDVAVANSSSSWISIFLGQPDGQPGTEIRETVAGSGSFSVAAGDFDGNGTSDLVSVSILFPNGQMNVLLADGTGGFDLVATAPISRSSRVATGDTNADGFEDIVAAPVLPPEAQANDVAVFLGLGDGSFSPRQRFTLGLFPYDMTVGDVDGDGAADILGFQQFGFVVSYATPFVESNP